jgi:hypothetical protein
LSETRGAGAAAVEGSRRGREILLSSDFFYRAFDHGAAFFFRRKSERRADQFCGDDIISFLLVVEINQDGRLNRLGKDLIYHDLYTEAILISASINLFCPPHKNF